MPKTVCSSFFKRINRTGRAGALAGALMVVITLAACSSPSPHAGEPSVHGSTAPDTQSEQSAVQKEKQQEKVEISMEEAIRIGMDRAVSYYDNLKVTEVHSYDNDHEPDKAAGMDGKREWWYVNFGNEASNYVSILIQNGEIIEVHNFDENGNNGLFYLSELRMTAEEAVKKAMELGLRGGDPGHGEEWVSGFNFKLSQASLVQTPEDRRIMLEVIGISPDGNFAHVDFDAATGELLLAEEKIEYADGLAEWKAFAMQ